MTKLEALAKDCIENHTHRLVDKPTKQDIYLREESIFIQGYRQSEKRIADLEEELKEWKDEWQEQVQKATDEGYARTLQTIQLTKVKELIKEIEKVFYNGEDALKRLPKIYDILVEAEQFLKGVEK